MSGTRWRCRDCGLFMASWETIRHQMTFLAHRIRRARCVGAVGKMSGGRMNQTRQHEGGWEWWDAEDQRRWARSLGIPVARIREIDGGRWPWSDRGHAVVARFRRRKEFRFRREYPWIVKGMSRDMWESLQRVKAESALQQDERAGAAA